MRTHSQVGVIRAVGASEDFRHLLPPITTSVTLRNSEDPRDCMGSLKESEDGGWVVSASDLAVDRYTGKSQFRLRTWSDALAELARSQGWSGLHLLGCECPRAMVVAVAAAATNLPYLMTFLPGEVEREVYGDVASLASSLRAATAFSVPCQSDLDLITHLISPTTPGVLVPQAVSLPEEAEEPKLEALRPGVGEKKLSWIGCWGHHSRASGFPILLDLVAELPIGLLVLGASCPKESYDLNSMVDHHQRSEWIVRCGAVTPGQALAELEECQLAIFPIQGSTQAQFPLMTYAAGLPVLASEVGPLKEIAGLSTLSPTGDWTTEVARRLESHQQRKTSGFEDWVHHHPYQVSERWLEVYRRLGWCS